MRGSLIVAAFFVAGCLTGWILDTYDIRIEDDPTRYILYFLMLQVGLGVGSDKHIMQILKTVRLQLLLVPVATIIGTLLFSTLAAFCISQWSIYDCLAVASGFAYYSLSSVMITDLKSVSLGVQSAVELGTIALITNIIREMMALLGAPLWVRFFGPLAPICAGGATTMDTTLPVITRYSGKDFVFIAVLHGILVDLTVPFAVSLFCAL